MKLKNTFKTLIVLFLVAFGMIFVKIGAKAAEIQLRGFAYNISTQFGEDASSSVGINYLATDKNTWVLLTEAADTSFKDAKRYDPPFKELNFIDEICTEENLANYPNIGDNPIPVYICEVDVTGLKTQTQYAYKVTNGTEESEIFKFTTAPVDSTTYTFAYYNDPQVYGSPVKSNSTYKLYIDLIENINRNAEKAGTPIDFYFGGGDMVNNGGDGGHWSMTFACDSFREHQYVATCGNHEYNPANNCYESKGTRFYAAHYNNPKNGVEGVREESTWWFKYGDTLFINLASGENKKLQVDWMEEIIKKHPSQYIIACVHYPPFTGSYSDYPSPWVSTDNSQEFIPVFDKYGVDLVLFGHEHSYKIFENYYDMKKQMSNHPGTFYMEMAAPPSTNGGFSARITVSDKSINIETYDQGGRSEEKRYLKAKRNPLAVRNAFTEEDFVETLQIKADKNDRTKAYLSYGGSAYENVLRIALKDDSGNLVMEQPIVNDLFNEFQISGLEPDKEYNYTLEYELKDNTVKTAPLDFNTFKDYGSLENVEYKETEKGYRMSFRAGNLDKEITSLKAYLNGEFYGNLSLKDRLFTIEHKDFLPGNNRIEIKGVIEGKETEPLIHRYNYKNSVEYIITLDPDGGICEIQSIKFDAPGAALPVPSKEGFIFKGWYEGETKIEATTELRDYNLKAKWEEITHKITYDLDGGENAEGNPSSFKKSDLPIALGNPSKEGFLFKGWYEGETKIEATKELRDYNLKAKWEEITYKITYDLDGGENAEGNPSSFKKSDLPIALGTPSKEGFIFKGWYEGETKIEATTELRDYNLKAKWEEAKEEKPKSGGCHSSMAAFFTGVMMLGFCFARKKKKR